MHLISPDGKHSLCSKTGDAAEPRSANIEEATCLSCLWALAKLLLMQLTGVLGRLHIVERSKTTKIGG